MLHLGDITKISGYTAPITDCVVGGSPCQGLSVAGLGLGLADERSGLFVEQIRIIKEMRDRDVRENGRSGVDVRPRYMVWENVPGAFSSNKGEDFRIVLEETARVKDKDAVIPQPPNGKWQTSGCILGDGWSIAWRVLDAQFWGVPQRRRRIALVADFGGHSAPEILFVRKGVSGNPQPSQPQGKATAEDATRGIGADDTAYTMKIRSGCDVDAYGKAAGKGALIQTEKSGTLSCVQDQYLFQPVGADQYNAVILGDSVSTLGVNCGMSHGRQCVLEPVSPSYSQPVVFENHSQDSRYKELWDVSETVSAKYGTGGNNQPLVVVDQGGGKSACNITEGKTPTLTCTHGGEPAVCYSLDPLSSNSMKSSNPHSGCHETDVARTIDTTYPDPSKNQGGVAVVETIGAFYPQMKAESISFRTDDISNCLVNGTNPGFQNGICYAMQAIGKYKQSEVGSSVKQRDYKDATDLVCAAVDCRNVVEADVNATLQSGAFRSLNCNNVVRTRYTVRRLTPLECERLQGYPDNWTLIGEPTEKVVEEFDEDTGEKTGEHIEQEFYYTNSQGKRVKASDAARYKALGNSIALPPWKWVMKRLCACYERDATLASLFDGIGGFPLIWEQINGKGSCLWASEIEEFPMAVTKVRIGE